MTIKNTLYSGEVELLFDTFRHKYTVNEEVIPSVTEILGITAKPALIRWSAGCATDYWKNCVKPGQTYDEVMLDTVWREAKVAHTKIKEDASSVGLITHKWVQDYIEGKNPETPINEMVAGATAKFLAWKEENEVEFLLSEQPCFHRDYKYAGTIDGICKIKGKLYIFDLKTNNALYHNSMGSQCAAYKMAREREYPNENYTGFVVARVGKSDDAFESWMQTDTKLFEDNFINTLNLFKTEASIKEKYSPKKYKEY